MKDVNDRIEEVTLALMYLGLQEGNDGEQRARTGFAPWVLRRFHELGLIEKPRSKGRSVVMTEEGLRRCKALYESIFEGAEGSEEAKEARSGPVLRPEPEVEIEVEVDLEPLRIEKGVASDLWQMALGHDPMEMRWYLDVDEREVIFVSDLEVPSGWDELDEEELAELSDGERESIALRWRIEEGYNTRFLKVPDRHQYDGWQEMADFVARVQDDALRERLDDAIHGRGAFRRFKDIVHEDEDVKEAWYAFSQEYRRRRIDRWLEGKGYRLEFAEEA